MNCRALAFHQLPHQPKLFLAYLEKFEKVKAFYAYPPTMQAVTRASKKLDYPQERRAEVAAILSKQNETLGTGTETTSNLERLAKGAVAVVSGQQVGLFVGPAYAIYKDLTRIPLGAEGERFAREAAELLEKDGGDLLGHYLSESYKAEETYGSAFGKLFARLFAKQGLILMDPLDAGLHKVAAPLYQHALAERDPLNLKLLERGKELERAGFDAQVKVTSKSTLLFYMGDGARQAISGGNKDFEAGERSWPRDELVHLTHLEPENFSPNALFRPVVQDYLLPTAAFIVGPAELSYIAQSEVVYEHLLGRMPVMLPRAGFTLMDAKANKLLGKYGLTVAEVWAGSQELRRKMEAASVPKSLSKGFEGDQKQIAKMVEQLGKQIAKLDSTLAGTVERTKKGIEFHLEQLRQKAGRALDQRLGVLASHEQHLESLLNPHKGLQERELCLLPFLARWGAGGLGELQKLCSSKRLGHHFIVSLP